MGNTSSTSQSHPPKPTTLTNIQLIRKLEDPHYGEIRLVRDLKTGEQIYLKEILFQNNEAYQAELIFYNKRIAVSHPNVVRILGCTGKERPAFSSGYNKIMVFIEVLTKTLAEEINVRLQTGIPFSENDILIVAENLIAGLSYFETQNIFHGDIRPENIFTTTHSYKLSDPYLNEQKNANALYHAILGTARTLLSPQLLIQVPRQNFNIECNKFKADVFSLGAVLLSMASLTSSEDLYDYERGLLDLDSLRERLDIVRRSYSKFTYEMIKNMLKIKEEERPDFITLANRLLPYQEDIRRKIDLSFFGVRAPSEEINHDGEEFFAKAYAELQEKIKLDSQAYLDEPETTRVKSSQPPTSRNINEDYEQQLPSTSRNLSTSNLDDIPAYAEIEHSSYIASIHSGRFEGQLPAKHKAHGQIFGKVDRPRMSPGANLNIDDAPAQVKQKGPQQKFTQYQNENQEQTMTPRQMAAQPQSQRQQLQESQEKLIQQRQLQLQQSQAKGQRPPQQFQQMQVQPQSQIHYLQEQQGQLSQRQYQAQVQPQVQKLQYESPQKWQTGQGSSQGQMSALVTRQMNVEQESNLNPRSPFGKQKRPSVNAQVQFEPHHPPQTSSHFHHIQSQTPDYVTLQKQNIPFNAQPQPSIQSQIQPQIQVQGIAESFQPQAPKDIVYDDLEAKIRAALQRSETTYQMASKNNLETKPIVSQDKETRDILAETSAIPPLNAYKSSNYGYYDVPVSDVGRFSPSEKTGETEDIINTLNLAKMEPSALPISDFLKENDRSQFYNYGQQINQYGGTQGYLNYGTKFNQQEELDFIRYGTEGETDYNYHYGTGGDRFTVKKQGQTIVLHE